MKVFKLVAILAVMAGITTHQISFAKMNGEEKNMQYETSDVATLLSLEAIRQLSLDYARLVNSRDANGIAKLFSSNGDLILPDAQGGSIHGTSNIERFYEQSLKTFHPWPLFHNHYIEISDPTHAIGTIDVELRYGSMNYKVALIGVYKDRYEKIGNEWKFSSRELQTLAYFN